MLVSMTKESARTEMAASGCDRVTGGTIASLIFSSDGTGLDLTKRVANSSEGETVGVFPLADSHDATQRSMVLDLVLQFVVVEVATEPNSREDHDMPVIHPGPADIASGIFVEIASNQPNNFRPRAWLRYKGAAVRARLE